VSGLSLKMQCYKVTIAGEPYVRVTVNAKKRSIGTTQLHNAMIIIRYIQR
jgi:hypothetical protein